MKVSTADCSGCTSGLDCEGPKDLVSEVISKVLIRIAPPTPILTLLAKSPQP